MPNHRLILVETVQGYRITSDIRWLFEHSTRSRTVLIISLETGEILYDPDDGYSDEAIRAIYGESYLC